MSKNITKKEVQELREELKNPKVETEEKLLTEEETTDWLVDGINKKIHEHIRAFFGNGKNNVADFTLSIDNEWNEVYLVYKKGEEIIKTENFKV